MQKLLTSPASISGAPISIEELTAVHIFRTVGEMADWVLTHVSNSLQSEILTLIGSVDAIGNPAAMFRHFRTGIQGAASGLLSADPMKAGGMLLSPLILMGVCVM